MVPSSISRQTTENDLQQRLIEVLKENSQLQRRLAAKQREADTLAFERDNWKDIAQGRLVDTAKD